MTAGKLGFTQAEYKVSEDGTLITSKVAVERLEGVDGPVSVKVTNSSSSATAGRATRKVDFVALNPLTTTATSQLLSWADQEGGVKFCEFTIINDDIAEGDERIPLSLGTYAGGAAPGAIVKAVLIIVDNDGEIPTPTPTPTPTAEDFQWVGTSLKIKKLDGTWQEPVDLKGAQGIQGIPGAQGAQGERGDRGDTGFPGKPPAHKWTGTALQFQNPDGTWGDLVDLKIVGNPPPAGTLWNPSTVNLEMWYDASVIDSVVLGGTGVSQWRDLSGNNRHLTQLVAANQPTFDQEEFQPTVTFDGTVGQFLNLASLDLGSNVSILAVVKGYGANLAGLFESSPYTNSYVFSTRPGVSLTGTEKPLDPFGTGAAPGQGTAAMVAVDSVIAPKSWNVICISAEYTLAAAKVERRINQGDYKTKTTPFPQGNTLLPKITFQSPKIGRASVIQYTVPPSYQAGNLSFNGEIAELIFVKSSVQSDLEKLTGYLAHKWGIQRKLPVDFKYKDLPPFV